MISLVAPFSIEVNGRVFGQVVVVGGKNIDPPPGYAAGTEYWTWGVGRPWRGAFTLVPRRTVPSHASFTWQPCCCSRLLPGHERRHPTMTNTSRSCAPVRMTRFMAIQGAAGDLAAHARTKSDEGNVNIGCAGSRP